MTKWIFYMLLILVADTVTTHQLFKIPRLFVHYQEHVQRNSSVTFVDFLSMHYWGDDINDRDNEQDMELPFKKVDSTSITNNYFPAPAFTLVNPLWLQKDVRFFLHDNHHRSTYSLESLFRPPQV